MVGLPFMADDEFTRLALHIRPLVDSRREDDPVSVPLHLRIK